MLLLISMDPRSDCVTKQVIDPKSTTTGLRPSDRRDALCYELRDIGIDIKDIDELSVRNIPEYLILKEFRMMKLENMKKEAQSYLRYKSRSDSTKESVIPSPSYDDKT